jgi:transcriptional regulator with XRE-family HTH domain
MSIALKPVPHPIKARLKRHKLTQDDFASFIGVAPSWARLILSGHRQPTEEVQRKIVELEELLDLE